jgi:hypothetical protein
MLLADGGDHLSFGGVQPAAGLSGDGVAGVVVDRDL